MSGIITTIEVSKGIAPIVDICGSVLSPPYVVPQYYYVCITAYVRNTGSETEEYKLELLSPQGDVVDTEPDTYWANVSPGKTISITVSGALMKEGLYNFSVRLKRCVCTSWLGCPFSCDDEPVDDVKNIQVSTEPGVVPPPPRDKYYDCVSGDCVEVYYPTQYLNDPTCQNKCVIIPPPPSGDKYYNCISGQCKQVTGTVGYKNDPTCQGKCAAPPPPPPPPPTDKYYNCISGECTPVTGTRGYKNDPRCGGACKPTENGEDDIKKYLPYIGVGVGILVLVWLSKRNNQ